MPQSLSLIFDLDGTLVDSRPGIAASLQVALVESGYDYCLTPDQLPIGPPLAELIQSIVDVSDQQHIADIAKRFVHHYDSSGYKQTALFDGVYHFLEFLHSSSCSLYIATNKRLDPTLKILDHLLISSFFKDVFAVDSCPNGYKSKSDMLKSLIKRCSLGTHAFYVGDRYDDFKAAVDNSLAFRFPFWGYDNERHMFPSNVAGIELNCNDKTDLASLLSLNTTTS